jgi:endonuclease G
MLTQRGYVVRYDGDLLVPLFTAERIDAARLNRAHRTDCFRPDPRIAAGLASRPADYDEAIFDQGHLAAFANQDSSVVAGNNSFVMSNMAPQTCQFNRGIWQILEGIVRLWAADRRTIYVISGSIFDRDLDGRRDQDDRAARMRSRNGSARVAIPTAFYKILAVTTPDRGIETLSFLMPHDQANPTGPAAFAYLREHVTTIAEIERRTGLHFFPRTAGTPPREANALWPFEERRAPRSLCRQAPRPDFDALWREQ